MDEFNGDKTETCFLSFVYLNNTQTDYLYHVDDPPDPKNRICVRASLVQKVRFRFHEDSKAPYVELYVSNEEPYFIGVNCEGLDGVLSNLGLLDAWGRFTTACDYNKGWFDCPSGFSNRKRLTSVWEREASDEIERTVCRIMDAMRSGRVEELSVPERFWAEKWSSEKDNVPDIWFSFREDMEVFTRDILPYCRVILSRPVDDKNGEDRE